jgi:uncharacterized membrane protein HdeD (DUF308 family)
MLTIVTRNWWVVALRGVLAILFGVLALFWPGLALATLVLLFGAFAFANGVLATWAAHAMRKRHQTWKPFLMEGIAGIIFGIFVLLWPEMTAIALILLVAAWALVTGVVQVAAAIRLRQDIEGEWMLALSGILSILLGFLFALWPGAGLVAVTWIIGFYAVLFGAAMVALSLRLRAMHAEAGGS